MDIERMKQNITWLNLEISKNAMEIVRLQGVMEDETRQMMQMQSEIEEYLKNAEVQACVSYYGGKLHVAE